jgi:hypothetical protein
MAGERPDRERRELSGSGERASRRSNLSIGQWLDVYAKVFGLKPV